jgi:tetratricopeptide (TPR) repeat protein
VSAALERWLLKLSQPLVVVLDDLQWAGDLFWALLPLLSKIARQQKVLLVLAHRSQELQSEPFAVEAMSNLRREGSVLQLELGGLSLEECATLARALGKMLDQSELERLYRLSSGNPLVFGEFLLGSARAEHLEGLLKSRFERLDEQARQALQAASVLGNVFDQAVWAAMLDFVPPTQRLIEARFLYQDEVKLAFQHDLIRSLIYKGQSGEQRQGWHSKAFSILRMQNERVAVLAHHALEAERHEDAIPFLRQAAEEAFGFGSMKEAKKFVTKVFSIKPFNSGEFDENLARTRIVQLKLAAEDRLSSAYFEEVEKLEQLALARGKFDIAFATFSLKLAVYEARGDAEGFFRAGDSMLARARSSGDIGFEIEAGCQIAFKTAAVFYKPQQALPLAVQVLELSELNGSPARTRFDALTTLVLCRVRLSQLEEAKDLLKLARALLLKHPELILFEHRLIFFEHYIAEKEGQHEDALDLRKQELEMHRTLGNEYGISGSLQNLIATLQRLGQYRAALIWAEELVERVQHRSQTVEPNMLAIHLGNLASLHAALEQPNQGEAVLEPISAWLKDRGKGFGAVKAWEALGQLYLVRGQYTEAHKAFANAIRLHDNPNYTMSMGWHLYAAYAACLAKMECEARSHVQTVLRAVENQWRGPDSVLLPLVQYVLSNQAIKLEEARFVMLKYVSAIKNHEFRQTALQEIPRHKIINRYWSQQDLQVITVQLSSSDGYKASVTWTLDSGASDKEHFLVSGKVGLRHHRLQRLVLEAAVQGAIPTQSELAQALGVTLQTIETDFATLRKKGTELKTLGMKRETAH